MKKCPHCSTLCKDNDNYCLKCNYPLLNGKVVFSNKEYENSNHITSFSKPTVQSKHIPKCPVCSSTNIKKIGTLERAASITMLGIFSKKINKSFKCKNCGYTF